MKQSASPFLAAMVLSLLTMGLLLPVKSFSSNGGKDGDWKAPERAAKKNRNHSVSLPTLLFHRI